MAGIPGQTYDSVLKNIDFCETIHLACNENPRLFYFVAPLAPFLDPASPAFEHPEKYGYKKLCHTLEDHRTAITQPSWKHMLSYETTEMTRDEIVGSTYEAAKRLNKFKLKYKLIDPAAYADIDAKITKSKQYIQTIDTLLALPLEEQSSRLGKLKKEIEELNKHSICGKNELKWEVKKNYSNVFSLALVGLELLCEDYIVKVKKQLNPGTRHKVNLHL